MLLTKYSLQHIYYKFNGFANIDVLEIKSGQPLEKFAFKILL